jgi:uncharacterized membrane protein
MRKELPLAITFISGFIVILANFLAPAWFVEANKEVTLWFQITTALFCALGVVNLTRIQMKKVTQRREGWVYGAIIVASMYLFMLVSFIVGQQAQLYKDMYNYINVPLSATMFSLLMFYIASAAYRAFRVRTLEATILLVAAAIVMLGRAPIGEAVLGRWIVVWTTWLMDYPNTAGMRGIQLGATLGGVAMALRVLLGIERAHLGGAGE